MYMHWFYEHIFPFFQTRTLFFSVTSPHRKPCVCHTHTEKQALYNSSVKSPCSETGEGLWGGGVVGVRLQPGRRNLRRCQVTTWPLNSSGFFYLRWGPAWKLIDTTSLKREITKTRRWRLQWYHHIYQKPYRYIPYQGLKSQATNLKKLAIC